MAYSPTPPLPHPAPAYRKIIHVDMDAFFASVEQLDTPHLRGQPVAVGGNGRRGVIAAASYEARKYGVRSAMPGAQALRLCPHLVFTPVRFERYREVSRQVFDIFARYTPLVEPLSLDEAYLDVTENDAGIPLAADLARQIKADILAETGLTASAGVSYCKFLAKIASGYRKPDGLTTIHPDRALDFIAGLKVEKFFGVGPATARRMHQHGLFTGADVRRWPLPQLQQHFGKFGLFLYHIVRGEDNRPVQPTRERKSLGAERTFATDLPPGPELDAALLHVAQALWRRAEKHDLAGSRLSVKVRFPNFETHTRAGALPAFPASADELAAAAASLLQRANPDGLPLRLLGLSFYGWHGARPGEPEDEPAIGAGYQLFLPFAAPAD